MLEVPKKPIHNVEDAMVILDGLIKSKMEWEPFYSEGKRKAPILQNKPDENLVEYFEKGLISNGRAVDLGCGVGRNAIFMAKQGCDVTAIDFSETAINKAQAFAESDNVLINFKVGSVFEATLPSDHFDIVYDSGLLHSLLPHRRPYYLEMVHRILKPDGSYGLTCFSPDLCSSPEDWMVYESGEMSSGIGYSETRLRAILTPFYEILEFRRMNDLPNDSELFSLNGLWAVLMKPKPEENLKR